MQLSSLLNQIIKSPLTQELLNRTERQDDLILKGTSRLAKGIISSSLAKKEGRPLLIITSTLEEASRWLSILELIGWSKSYIYPSSESSPYEFFDSTTEITWGQLQVLSELINLDENNDIAIITTDRSMQSHLPPYNILKNNFFKFNINDEIDLNDINILLTKLGYDKKNITDQEGQWSRRGDIIDIFPVSNELPVRLELFGNTIEKIKEFDPITQRSINNIKSLNITPKGINPLIAEQLRKKNVGLLSTIMQKEDLQSLNQGKTPEGMRRLISYAWDNPSSLIDFIPTNTFVVIDEKTQCVNHGNQWFEHANISYKNMVSLMQSNNLAISIQLPCKLHKSTEELLNKLNQFKLIQLTELTEIKQYPNGFDISNKNIEAYPNNFSEFSIKIKEYVMNRNSVYLLSAQPSRAVALLEEHECPSKFIPNPQDYKSINNLLEQKTPIALKNTKDSFVEGFILPAWKIVLITDKEFFGQSSLINTGYIRRRRGSSSKKIDPFKMQPGDYVVHRNHGIGQFIKLEKFSIQGDSRDYLLVKYLDGLLRVAADQLGSLVRYRSSNTNKPKINKLGGATWIKTKEKAAKRLRKIAIDLVKLYAEREKQEGYAFPSDGPWQKELEDSFRFEATVDQQKAVIEVKTDMENIKPMDRLICGDVGFGKTEVAIRAIFKAITAGKQIALLAPTTVLAQQHWRTITERFAPYPIKVSLLNRFKSNKEKITIAKELSEGKIDAVIGTHLLLNKKINFNDLGLLVIDEEQRFGVQQKEKIKVIKKQVDVLTLSATPIPRTLYMSLSGVREMSLISTPPPLRLPIKTNLSKLDDEVIRSAISQELDRGGQIFYVVPRVEGIENVASKLKVMIPNIKLLVAHGQMSESQLENSMIAFNAGEFDLMLCTTIIESGLDIPRVNTILIEDSHRFGLSQLYQLRGRVGRSGVQAYAWLFYPNNEALNDSARQRLRAIQEFTTLGSGYQLAIRDMEIRGVGNILGEEQSGQMEVIGFDLYMELLQEALAEIQGQDIPEVDETQIDLQVTAFIPGDWIIDNEEKLAAYRSASKCNSDKELMELASTWIDRYGTLPKSVETLIEIMKLKLISKSCGFSRIKLVKPNIVFETLMDEPAFRLLRQGLPTHLQGRLIYKKEDKTSLVIARGLGLQTTEKQLEILSNWLISMYKQIQIK
tara:strand:- start:2032 stop:5541 length:3510 start_codon:yes stop_codon:yes gene_type:complete